MKLPRLLFASLILAVSISSVQAQVTSNADYLLKTQFRGEGEALTNDPKGITGQNTVNYMAPVKNSPLQYWRFHRDRDMRSGREPGTYTIYNINNKIESPLRVEESTGVVKCTSHTNEDMGKWIIEKANDGYFRLKNMYKGSEHCLEGNQAKGEAHSGNAFMAPCKNEGGQLWKIERVKME